MYYDEGGKVQLSHYCSPGNHPTVKMTKSEPAKLPFAVSGTVEGQAMHMHELILATPDKDHPTADWLVFDKGAKGPTHSFAFTRKKT